MSCYESEVGESVSRCTLACWKPNAEEGKEAKLTKLDRIDDRCAAIEIDRVNVECGSRRCAFEIHLIDVEAIIYGFERFSNEAGRRTKGMSIGANSGWALSSSAAVTEAKQQVFGPRVCFYPPDYEVERGKRR